LFCVEEELSLGCVELDSPLAAPLQFVEGLLQLGMDFDVNLLLVGPKISERNPKC